MEKRVKQLKEIGILSDLIHKSGIKLDYTDRGTDGQIQYDSFGGDIDGDLHIFTTVIGYTGLSIDDDDWGDDDGEDHILEIK